MRYRYMLLLFFLFTFHVSLFAQDIDSVGLPQDKIIAIVNSEIITQSEVEELLASFYLQMPAKFSEERKEKELTRMQKTVLERLIEDKLILAEAKKQGIKVPPEAIKKRLSEIKKEFKDDAEFSDALASQGLTPADFRKKIEQQMMISAAVEFNVRRNIVVSPVEITAYYQANLKDFQQLESADINSILCVSQEKAKEAFLALKNGEDFETVKQSFSPETSLDKITKGELMPEIEDVVFSLEEGKFSDIVKMENGFYIFKLLKKNPQAQIPLPEVETVIKNLIIRRKTEEHFREWIAKLKEDAYIVIR